MVVGRRIVKACGRREAAGAGEGPGRQSVPRRARAARAAYVTWPSPRADGRARVVAGGLRASPRRLRRQPRRQAAVRRPALQLQQAGAAGRQHHRRTPRLHQAQAQPAHRCRKSAAAPASR